MSIHSLRYTPTNYKSIGFTSIKPEMRIAEQVLKEFKQEFPYLQSSSIIGAKIDLHEENPKCRKIIESLYRRGEDLETEIDNATNALLAKRYMSIDDFLIALKQHVKKSGKANCAEEALIIYKSLQDKGFKPQVFQMRTVLNNGLHPNHYSTVFNLKEGARIDDPTTWGSKAIIVDGWKRIVMKATDALEFFKQTLTGAGKYKITRLYFIDANPRNHVSIPHPEDY